MLDDLNIGTDPAAPRGGPAVPKPRTPVGSFRVRTADAASPPPWWRGLDDDVYLSPEAAAVVAGRRKGLSNPWTRLVSDATDRRPLAILARQVATPNYETLWFVRLARRQGFRPLIIEHRSDRFTVNNAAKCHLGRLPVIVGRSRDGRVIVRRQKILDPAAAEGRHLYEIRTQHGEPLLDYHHRQLRRVLGEDTPHLLDMSEAVESWSQGPRAYYVEFFQRLTGPVALFEDFVVDERTARFFQAVVRPAFQQVLGEAGRRPQVVKLTPGPQMSSSLWTSYPAAVAEG